MKDADTDWDEDVAAVVAVITALVASPSGQMPAATRSAATGAEASRSVWRAPVRKVPTHGPDQWWASGLAP